MKLSDIIRKYCEDKGTNMHKISIKAGVHSSMLSRLLAGHLGGHMAFVVVVKLLVACEYPASEVYNVTVE